jgi:hypothetical protein
MLETRRRTTHRHCSNGKMLFNARRLIALRSGEESFVRDYSLVRVGFVTIGKHEEMVMGQRRIAADGRG